MKVKIIKSFKRRRTAQAGIKNGLLHIYLPAFLSEKRGGEIVERFKKSFLKKQAPPSNSFLKKRADILGRKYFTNSLPDFSIRWSENQKAINGSCSVRRRTIRVSKKLAKVPRFVLDGLIVHELTHLLVPGHGKKFWEIANRYPLMERTRGYLMGMEKSNREQ